MKVERITTTIRVTNLTKGVQFYEKIGFNKDWIWPDSDPTHASVSSNGISLMMALESDTTKIQKADLYFRLENVRSYHKWLKQIDTSIPDLYRSAYGMLDFAIIDPWGHQLTFGTAEGEYVES